MQTTATPAVDEQLVQRLRGYFQALSDMRRGICLLNAGAYEDATLAFSRASVHSPPGHDLAGALAACYLAQGATDSALMILQEPDGQPREVTDLVREALALWSADRHDEAIAVLQDAIGRFPGSAEARYQLGNLLVDAGRQQEAEDRYRAALEIEPDHTDALVNLAACCGVRNAPREALPLLQKAQRLRPSDTRIGLMLAQASMAVQQMGEALTFRADMPAIPTRPDEAGLSQLTVIIEQDPDFVDAFLCLPESLLDREVYALLLRTLELALERQPQQAELHFHCGQVLQRLERYAEAIDANERAVGLNPRMTRALIDLGVLYSQTDRTADAAQRLEQAVRAGAAYADVFYLLGNLYREEGHLDRARSAYRKALSINRHYRNAQEALDALPVS